MENSKRLEELLVSPVKLIEFYKGFAQGPKEHIKNWKFEEPIVRATALGTILYSVAAILELLIHQSYNSIWVFFLVPFSYVFFSFVFAGSLYVLLKVGERTRDFSELYLLTQYCFLIMFPVQLIGSLLGLGLGFSLFKLVIYGALVNLFMQTRPNDKAHLRWSEY